MSKSGIYQIRNTVNGKTYVGSTKNLNKRRRQHWCELRNGSHRNSHLQHAWDKHREDAFIFETLIICHPSMCLWYEQQFLDQWQPDYNICSVAGSSAGVHTGESHHYYGKRLSEEHRAKISKSMMGSHNGLGSRWTMSKHKRRVGERAPCVKLTEADVREIKKRLRAGETREAIATDYPVSNSQIGSIKRGETWKHIL